jgi:hypothetical protein
MRSLWTRVADLLAEPWVEEVPSEEHPYQSPSQGASAGGRFVQAAVVSAAAHAALLAVLAQFAISEDLPQPEPLLISTSEAEELIPPPELEYQMAEARDEPADTALSALAMSLAPAFHPDASLRGVLRVAELPAAIAAPRPEIDLDALQLDERLLRAGSLGEQMQQVEGAVDRITEEIMSNVERQPTLVVWIMDASISLKADRQAAADRLRRIYRELGELGAVDGSDGPLTSAVVAFGQQAQEMAPPGSETDEIVAAIRNVPTDDSGVENVFQTVVWCAARYQRQRSAEHRREMFVIWTDESGNDYDHLENAVTFCRNNVIPVYVVGPSAMFGKERGTVAYRHTDGKTYQLPVDRGPDAVRDERLNVPFWFDGPQYESLRSGLTPFALTRLTRETGGAYFIMDHESDRAPFSVETMLRYAPEYDPPAAYVRHAMASPLRRAVLAAVDVTRERKLKGSPRLRFAPTGKSFYKELREAQEVAAYNAPTLQQALSAFGPRGFEEAYAKESPRWRAWYDLTYGRLLAMYVRCNEYNWACAVMKGKGADFVDQKSNRWQFRPDPVTRGGSQNEKMAKEAVRLLSRCATENPGTPWALLARRELDEPLGFKVIEAYEPPPPPPPKTKAAPPKKPPAPPPPPPKSNERRREEPKKLPRPVEIPLPKL